MKFTYPQKKWVLTSALLAVLGFNVSFNTHNDGIASADFASTSGDLTESKVYTAEGVMPVKYIDNGDEEVLALVPKRTTEGKVCEGKCGYDTIVLSAKNKSDIDALNVELMKKLAEQPAAPKKKVAKKEEVAEADAEATGEEEVVAKKKVSPLDRIMKRDCKSSSDDASLLACVKDAYLAILEDPKKAKDITPIEALDFYKKEIQSRLVRELAEVRRITSAQRRAATNPSAWQSYRGSDDFGVTATDINDMIKESLYIVEDLITKVPSKFENVRSRVIQTETDILKFEAAQIKAQESAGNYPEASAKLSETTYMHDLLQAVTKQALSAAASGDRITVDQETAYTKYMNDFSITLANLLAQKVTPGTAPQIDPSINLSQRLQNPGRTNGTTSTIGTLPTTPTTPGTIPSGVSSRTGATLSTQPQGQLTVYPNSSGGVTFGTPRDATAEALQQRALIRGRQ